MATFDIKKLFQEKQYGWHYGFKFDIQYSKNRVARIWINDRKTKYYAGGYGYDKTSQVISLMVNDLIGKRILSGPCGFDCIQTEAARHNIELLQLYSGRNFDVFEIKFKDNQ